MNRAIPAAFITAIGLGALASFKSTSGLPTKSSGAIVVPRSTVPAGAKPTTRTTPTTRTPTTSAPRTPTSSPGTTPAPTTPAPTAPATTTPATSAQARTITGGAVDSQYGTVQVQVTLRGSQITNVVALQLPDSHQRSVEISQQAEPILQQEVLQAQSAQIDIVSGATFTSDSYAQSLQSALDQARG